MSFWESLINNPIYKEFSYEITKQLELFIFGLKMFNWKWFVFAFFISFVVYAVKLKSIRRVYRRTINFTKQKRFRSELVKDIKFYILYKLYKPFIFVISGFNIYYLDVYTRSYLADLNLPIPKILYLDATYGPAFKLFITLLAVDFSVFVMHYIKHHTFFFWSFHKVHHRATSINPFTKLRIHPFGYLMHNLFTGVLGTFLIYFTTAFYYIPDTKPQLFYTAIALLIGSSLRHLLHSHVRLNYGIFSYIFVSPAMHQVHHSILEKHHNKNLGIVFSFWDLMFGTFYLPQKNEAFKFGVPGFRNKIPTISEEFLLPFKDLYQHYKFKSPKLISRPSTENIKARS